MIAPGVAATMSLALAIAPFIPSEAGVKTSSAPSRASILRRSTDIDSGMTRMSLYPRAAATNASAMPVFPEVGSTRTPRPGAMRPCASRASIIATPMRSLTLPIGLKNSSFASKLARTPFSLAMRSMRTSGVSPIVSVIDA